MAVWGEAGRGVSLRLLASLARTGYLARAVELARATVGERTLADSLFALVEAAAEAGDLWGAQALAESFAERALHDEALVTLVPAWGAAGERERAVALAERIRYPHNWGRAWAALAKAEADRGDLATALVFAVRADEVNSTAGGGVMSADVLALVAEVAFAAGDHAWAAQLADRKVEVRSMGYDRAWGGLTPLARVLACEVLGGNLDRVDALLPSAPVDREADPSRAPLGARVMAELVSVVADAADDDVALALADRAERLLDLDRGPFHAALLEAVTLLLAGRGRLEQAVALADRLGHEPECRAARQAQIVGELARHGEVDRAEALAHAITVERHRTVALIHVVRELAGRGDGERAEALAMSVGDAWDRDEAFVALVQGLAQCGEWDRAEVVAASIVHRATRARALVALVERSTPSRARRLAAQAVLLEGWSAVVDVLEPIVPCAAATVADQLSRRPSEPASYSPTGA